jgi:hypothetical protein
MLFHLPPGCLQGCFEPHLGPASFKVTRVSRQRVSGPTPLSEEEFAAVAAAARQVPSLDRSGGEQFVACVLSGSNSRQQAEEQKRAKAAAAAAAAATRH